MGLQRGGGESQARLLGPECVQGAGSDTRTGVEAQGSLLRSWKPRGHARVVFSTTNPDKGMSSVLSNTTSGKCSGAGSSRP